MSLRTIGARLASRPTWTLAAVTERLADGRDRLAELAVGNTCVEKVFQTSYRRLDPELSRAFVLTGLCDCVREIDGGWMRWCRLRRWRGFRDGFAHASTPAPVGGGVAA
ncbi:hypothetical protein ABIA39_003913 [Nocardia sp. GAS34]|uniref:hypothetical protein n=1 Tax=unclassified Nocardia TaxID=2637762 RepID=UPI003D20C15D